MWIDPLSRKLLSGEGQRQPISLMYHSIHPGKTRPASPWAISLHQFQQQLDLLQDYGWTTQVARQLSSGPENFPPKTVIITFDDGYANNFSAFEALIKRNMTASWFIVSKDIGKMSSWSDADAPTASLLDAIQLNEMQDAGMEIGSHSYSHCRLTEVSAQQVDDELLRSKSDLSTLLNHPVTSFAYPYGLYNALILSATQSASYQHAFTTRSGFGRVNDNPLEIRRVSIMADDSLANFAQKLIFADNSVGWGRIGQYGLDRITSRLGLK